MEIDATTADPGVAENADTEISPQARPDVLVGPGQRQQRQEIEAALFGGPEAIAYGRYRLLNRLGEGGMGIVYAAYDEHLERESLRRFCQAGEGLAAAHAQGIIHRDFKPQNARGEARSTKIGAWGRS